MGPMMILQPYWEDALAAEIEWARSAPPVDFCHHDCLRQARRIVLACSGFDILFGRAGEYNSEASLRALFPGGLLQALQALWADFHPLRPSCIGRLDLAVIAAGNTTPCVGVGIGDGRAIFPRDAGGCRFVRVQSCTHAWRIPRHV